MEKKDNNSVKRLIKFIIALVSVILVVIGIMIFVKDKAPSILSDVPLQEADNDELENNIVPEQILAPTTDYTVVTFSDLIVAGESYRYTINGVEKTGEAVEMDGSVLLGNLNDYSQGTGAIFECIDDSVYFNTKLRTEFTIKVDHVVEGRGGSSSTNLLKGKIAAFTGDSLCYGANYAGGYPKLIGEENGMTVQNIGVSEGMIVSYQNEFCISESIDDLRADADYVILEGGINDAWRGTEVIPLGTLTSGYKATLDRTTFAGAFEYMLKNAIERFPSAKIGYIFPHKVIANFDAPDGPYYLMAKSALEKWGIPYLDLNLMTPPLGYLDSLKSTYTDSSGHPNELGYRKFYVPQITAFMQMMQTDKSLIAKTVTENGTYLAAEDDIDGYSSVTVNVSAGGGSAMNVQVAEGCDRVATTSYTEVNGQSITVAKTGTYNVYWTGFRSSTSGTYGSQLYIGNTAYGSKQTTFTNLGQSVKLTGVQLTQGQVVGVRARAKTTSDYMYVGNLIIEQIE